MLGDHLWDALLGGDTSVSSLIGTWGIIIGSMTGGTPSGSEMHEGSESGQVSEQGEEGSVFQSGNGQAYAEAPLSVTFSGNLPSPETPRVRYPSPKDYVLPVYPFPKYFIKQIYPSPAVLGHSVVGADNREGRPPLFTPQGPTASSRLAPAAGPLPQSQLPADITAKVTPTTSPLPVQAT